MESIKTVEFEKLFSNVKSNFYTIVSLFEAIFEEGELDELNEWASKISWQNRYSRNFRYELRRNYLHCDQEQLDKYYQFITNCLKEFVPFAAVQFPIIIDSLVIYAKETDKREPTADREKELAVAYSYLIGVLLPRFAEPPLINKEHAIEFLKQQLNMFMEEWSDFMLALNEEIGFSENLNLLAPKNANGKSKDGPESHNNSAKLHWEGSDKQLYSVLKQLKNRDLIKNSYDELVDFLFNSVAGFENKKKGTVLAALSKDDNLPENMPKKNRVVLDTYEEIETKIDN